MDQLQLCWPLIISTGYRHLVIHFASAVVAVDSSHMTVSSSTSRSSFSPPLNFVSGHVSTMVHGLSLAIITRKSLGKTPFVQICTTWALACPEMVEHRPRVTREIKTWLLDSTK